MSTCAAALVVTLAFPLSATASPGPALDDAVSAPLNSELAEITVASDGSVGGTVGVPSPLSCAQRRSNLAIVGAAVVFPMAWRF